MQHAIPGDIHAHIWTDTIYIHAVSIYFISYDPLQITGCPTERGHQLQPINLPQYC
jgi:hypothetical protein